MSAQFLLHPALLLSVSQWVFSPLQLEPCDKMHARTQPTLLSQRGDFITSISTADSAAGALINRHFTSFILSNRERGCCCAAAQNACVRVCSQTNVWRKMNQPMTPRAYAIAPP